MKKVLLIALWIGMTGCTLAQSWQWGKRAGSSWILPYSNEERPLDMTTDQKGNVYMLSWVYPNALLTVDTIFMSNYFTSNATNILLTSYSCDGTLRWKKIIGTQSGAYAKTIQTDTLGGVYVLAKIYSNGTPVIVSNDTSFVDGNRQLYVMKFDTAGSLKWIHSPLSDTVSFQNAFYNAAPIDLHVDKGGNLTVFTELPAGNNLNGALTLNSPAAYALHYDRFGSFLSATPVPFRVSGLKATYRMSVWATVAPNGNFIFTGYRFYIPEDTVYAGSTALKGRSFLIVSDPTGQLLWYREPKVVDTTLIEFSNSIFTQRAATDEENNIYLSGCAAPNDTLAGHVFVNLSQPAGSAMPMAARFSPEGNLDWISLGSNNAIALAYGVSYYNNKVAITGLYSNSHMSFPGSSLFLGHQVNEGRDPFLAVFDADNGNLLVLDSLHGLFGFNETGYLVTQDTKGNIFLAGSFDSYMLVNGNALQSAGSTDIFLAKYGVADCNFTSTASISESLPETRIRVYPNPAFDQIHVSCDFPGITQAEILDITGKQLIVRKFSTPSMEVNIDIDNLASAVYLLKLYGTDGSRKMVRVLVTRDE